MKVVFRVSLLNRTVGRSKNLEGVGGNPRPFEGEVLLLFWPNWVPNNLTEPIQFFSENQAGNICMLIYSFFSSEESLLFNILLLFLFKCISKEI